jgi:hypothetical protein
MVTGKNIKIFISGTPPSIHFYPWHGLPSGKTLGLAVLFILANLFMSGNAFNLICVFMAALIVRLSFFLLRLHGIRSLIGSAFSLFP